MILRGKLYHIVHICSHCIISGVFCFSTQISSISSCSLLVFFLISFIIRWRDWDRGNLDRLIWDLTSDQMTQRLKALLAKSGIKTDHISMHSLRSGFLCNGVVDTIASGESLEVFLAKSRQIAGWKNKTTQDVYMKNNFLNGVLNVIHDTNNDSVKSWKLSTSNGLSTHSDDTNYKDFQAICKRHLKRKLGDDKSSNNAYRQALANFTKNNSFLEVEAQRLCKDDNRQLRDCRERCARDFLIKEFHKCDSESNGDCNSATLRYESLRDKLVGTFIALADVSNNTYGRSSPQGTFL